MEQVFIHIGLMKTATTFFQETVFPQLGNTLFLPKNYIKYNHHFEKLKYTDDTLYDEDEIRKEFEKFKNRKVLISSETLAGNPVYNSINRTSTAKRLKKIFPNATIILFIRGQFDMLLSLYKLHINESNTIQRISQFYSFPVDHETSYQFQNISENHDISDYNTYYRGKIHVENFKYFELIMLYKELFDNVRVFLYEDFKNNPKEFINSLEDVLKDNFKNKGNIDFNKYYRKGISNSSVDHKLFYNKLELLTNRKIIIHPLCFVYKYVHRENNFIESFFDKVGNYYAENNNLVIKKFPEIGIQRYPQNYQF
jgi:hypothetical protein